MGGKASEKPTKKDVCILRTLELLTSHLTASLCERIFREVRDKERQREWSLEALVMFWTEVILRAPASLRQALQEITRGLGKICPPVEATPESFFQKCKDMRPDFFKGVLQAFIGAMVKAASSTYASDTAEVMKRFGAVLILDGSKLEAIRHRLKILWDQRSVILPGCVIALYHLHQGLLRGLTFCADAAKGEIRLAEQILIEALAGGLAAAGNLIVGDRYYATAQFFEFLSERGLFGLFRRNRRLKLHKVRLLSKGRCRGLRYEEWLVETGASPKTPRLTLRWIRIRLSHSQFFEVLTNVLDSQKLTVEETMLLYRQRWSIERMFYDLKVVLNLNRLYAANPSAIAMQVYAGTIVYCALRVAQAEVADEAGISPEDISTQKFFARFMAAVGHYWNSEWTFLKVCERNRTLQIQKPTWEDMPFATIPLRQILREKRTVKRRKRRFCRARRLWKSLAHVNAL